jgi:predicted ArsR family transcriptional regulator
VGVVSEEDAAFSAAVAAITSAFGDSTRRQIYLAAREADGATAAVIAARFGLHPNVARHHLDKLAAGGYLHVTIEHGGAGAGRPSKRYSVTPHELTLGASPPRDDLVVRLLARALTMLDPVEAECMAEVVGEEYGRSLASQMAPADSKRTIKAAMTAVADALTAHGFAAHTESGTTNGAPAIVAENCPFGEMAMSNPVICAVDRGMVRGLLAGLCGDSIPVRMSSRARGDAACSAVAG